MKTIKFNDDTTITYTSIPPLAVPAITANYEKEFAKPEKPTYTTKAAGGAEVTFEHDETTISDKDGSKEAYEQYLVDINEWQSGLTEKLMMLFLLEGIELNIDKKTQKKWDTRLSRYYNLTDLEEDDLHLLYLQTFVFKNQEAIQDAIQEIMVMTGVKQEDVVAADKLF